MSASDLRKDLEAAFPKDEPEDEVEVNEDALPENNTPESTQEESDPGPADAVERPHPEDEEPEQQAEKPEKAEREEAEEKPRREKRPTPPVDWSPEDRKAFGELPENIQKAIHQREVHINRALQDTVEARRLAEGFVKTVEPYYALMQAEGASDPMQAINNLLQTAATLKMGSSQQKAQRIAQLVQHYDIDVETLDKALAGSLPKNDEESKIQRMLDERLQPVNQFMGQLNQWQQQQQWQTQQEAMQSVQQMRENVEQFPYIEEVRHTMADILDIAAANGMQPSLEEVYMRACMATPGVADQVMEERMNGMMQKRQQKLGDKRNAASSVSGRQSGGNSKGPNLGEMSLREAIAAQFPGGSNRI